ncbi:hypothetical protein COCCADRAFT_110770 [Bipolaris zeicola 26-R-13]|uniref:Uncharacterized protein n=1 Tax=Cochliobolus carbonum (strain 26-R-13) TaxID=930089 RepID=W6XKQ7_COCC2|nr:uncharacterized protein COCCADRAFT_110770 [Bipolaris zeicola 26-R-13]EUC27792.1 hypothetical protein COCCADRAFT_110770 [Bipolaris zeicola 26-R-13]
MIIAELGHVMCHHAKTVPSVMAGRQPDGRTGSNEDIRTNRFHYLLSSRSTQVVLSY